MKALIVLLTLFIVGCSTAPKQFTRPEVESSAFMTNKETCERVVVIKFKNNDEDALVIIDPEYTCEEPAVWL
jgi:PBP1b-binding outer membrane lipoprotein LpoB